MKPKDPEDVQFAARLIIEGMVEQSTMQQVLEAQSQLIEKGKPMTVAQICVRKGWLTRSEARFLLADDRVVPDLIDGYTIGGVLGSGGMSRVYDAKRTADGQVVALKVMKPALAHQEIARTRFEREAELMMKLEHENIVGGFELVSSDGLLAFAMEKVPGKTLLEMIEGGEGTFNEDAALYVILQTARALTAMYAEGVVHRDVKPDNVLLTADNTVKLCDLGLATAEGGKADGAEGTTVGTVEYISPEQARAEDAVDVRSDIYALGCTLYHMVVGEIPFQGEDAHETMAKRFFESLDPSKLSRVSPHMHYFIQKMMATDKEIRYQSPEELIADVEESIRGKKELTTNPLTAKAGELDIEKPFETGGPKAPTSGVTSRKRRSTRGGSGRGTTPRRRRR